jgi:hypothetical protein
VPALLLRFLHQRQGGPARPDAVYTPTAYSDSHHQFGAVSTHRQAAAVSSLHLEPLVVGLRPSGPEGFLPVRS